MLPSPAGKLACGTRPGLPPPPPPPQIRAQNASPGRLACCCWGVMLAIPVLRRGHDFRPSYLMLGELREEFKGVPLVAVTATATAQVQRSIIGAPPGLGAWVPGPSAHAVGAAPRNAAPSNREAVVPASRCCRGSFGAHASGHGPALASACCCHAAEALSMKQPVVLHGGFNRHNIQYLVRHKELLGDGSQEAALADLLAFLQVGCRLVWRGPAGVPAVLLGSPCMCDTGAA